MLNNPYPELTEKCKEFRKILYNPNTSDDEFFNTVDKFYEVTQKLLNYFNMKLKELEDKCSNAETDEESHEIYQQILEMGKVDAFMESATGLDPGLYSNPIYPLERFVLDNGYSDACSIYNCVKRIYNKANSEEDVAILATIMNGIKAMLTVSYHYRRYILDSSSLILLSKTLFRKKWSILREMGSCDDFIKYALMQYNDEI